MVTIIKSHTRKELRNLRKYILKNNLLSKKQFLNIIKNAKVNNKHVAEALLEENDIDEDEILTVMSGCYDFPVVSLKNVRVAPYVINLIPKEIARLHNFVIFKKRGQEIDVAAITPNHDHLIKLIEHKTGFTPQVHLTTKANIDFMLDRYDGDIKEDFEVILGKNIDEILKTSSKANNIGEFLPVVKIVEGILEKAVSSKASDVHIEPGEENISIRFRVDGLLNKVIELPLEILPALIARVKIMANLKIDEHIAPQDGRFQFGQNDDRLAIRVSIIPTLYGPKVALRLLKMQDNKYTLHKLGLNKIHQKIVQKEIAAAQGMILATGPTGSGKTTTLYTILQMLNREDINICTVEDPIEYGISSINQMQIKPNVGVTFAVGLRALMRQDPNVIMVGEIRDTETASIAINASMTGHMVLSTLHTNNAFLTVQRMVEMGLQPFLVGSVVNVIIGQRLVRKLCRHCRIKVRDSQKEFEKYNQYLETQPIIEKLQSQKLLKESEENDNMEIYRAKGCNKCNNTGFSGRMGIYEILVLDEEIRKMILEDSSELKVRDYAMKKGTLTMIEDGILKVCQGSTTIEEVLRVTKE